VVAGGPVEAGPLSTFTSTIRLRLRRPARLRNREFGLLIVACLITVMAIALVQFGALKHLDFSIVPLGIGLAVLVFAVHFALRIVAIDADPFILPVITVLNGLGIAMIYRIDIAKGLTGWDAAATRQIVWTAIAIAISIAVIATLRNYRVLQRYRFTAMIVGIALLLLPMLPLIGIAKFGARIWIHVGPLTFQPGELAKIALAIFFAGYLVTARDSLSMVGRRFLGMKLPRARDLGPILIVFVASMAVLVFQHDLGTSLLYFGLIGLSMFFAGAYVASRALSYVGSRFDSWLDAFNQRIYDANGGSYQLVQGLFGLSNGGLIGTGLGQGRPQIVPLAESDYIIASLGEELGLVGIFAILALYLIFVARGFRIGFVGQDDFGRLLAVGLSFIIALQVFIVIGGVTRVIPLTGLTTPFLAAGGSSLVANWIIAALLLRLSDNVRATPLGVVE
jgi:cell division protein FtsW (lipid II flippase)